MMAVIAVVMSLIILWFVDAVAAAASACA